MSAPAPVITSLETVDWPWEWYPSGPRAFAKRAQAAGWDVRIGFARGHMPGQAADTWELHDSIGVWVDGYGRRAAALWGRNPDAEFSAKKQDSGTIKDGELPSGMKWSSSGTMILLGGGMSFPYANLSELDEWVKARGVVIPGWYEAATKRVLDARAASKANAKSKAEANAAEREAAARAR